MKANFALSLSFDGIRLLHRAAGGWRRVGDVALDDPDLGAALNGLREAALALEPDGLRTKLIIPDTQIKYITIDTPEADDAARRSAARMALDGVTPYSVAELAFDISPDGDTTHVAAVAKDTLAEAEAFAANYRFMPISAVAIPGDEAFLGEPFFGATGYAAVMLEDGAEVEPDHVAVVEIDMPVEAAVIVADDLAADGDDADAVDDPVTSMVDDTPPDEIPSDAQDDDALATVEAENNDEDPIAPDETRAADTDNAEPDAVVDDNETQPETVAADLSDAEGSDALDGGTDTDATTAPTSGTWVPSARTADLDVSEPYEDPEDGTDDALPVVAEVAPDDADLPEFEDPTEDLPPILGFASRRAADRAPEPVGDATATAHINADGLSADEPETDDTDAAVAAADVPPTEGDSTAQSAGFASRRLPPIPTAPAAPSISPTDRLFASRFKRTALTPQPIAATPSEKQRMTVFGARKPEPRVAAAAGGNGRIVGLAVTAALLITLAGVAAWATVFREDGIASFFSAPQVADAPVTLDELAPEPEPDIVIDSVQTASLDTTPPEGLETALATPEPDLFDPDAAEAHYAVSGIWSIPPDVPQAPALLGLEDLYLTSIDRSNLSFDAVALAPVDSLRTDDAFGSPSNPAPSGTRFVLDGRGLVVPTAQGALSPEGVVVYLGRPSAVPPATPDREARVAALPDPRAELAAFRPKARPDGLVEQTERQQLGGLSRAELAAIRPQTRPITEKQKVEEEDETPTAQAAAESKRPSTRPRNFARIVDKARSAPKRAAPAEETAPRQVAAVAPRTVTPKIPSSASTAKQATVKRAINLNRINLMGVYGTPSNRRALVRLSNGRYKKVKVGDRIDGGKVSAIGEGELRYQKGARNIVLKMPKT